MESVDAELAGKRWQGNPMSAELFQDYDAGIARSGAYDEMFTAQLQPRDSYRQIGAALDQLTLSDVSARADSMARTFLDRGVTFDYAGEERPFPLDIVPRVIAADEWAVLERGVAQRVRTLEAFLNDVYDKMNVVNDGVVPRSLITIDSPSAMTLQSPFHVTPRPAYDYVVTKNNHYIIVDALHLPLHYAAVSLIGSAAKGVMNRLGKPSRCSRM